MRIDPPSVRLLCLLTGAGPAHGTGAVTPTGSFSPAIGYTGTY